MATKKTDQTDVESEDRHDEDHDSDDHGTGTAGDDLVDRVREAIAAVLPEFLKDTDKNGKRTLADDEERMERLVRAGMEKLKREEEREHKLKKVDELDETLKKLTEKPPVSNTLGSKIRRFMWGGE